MITSIEITNFKSLREVRLATRHLNLLTGLNGSGKSSLIQVFLLLAQSGAQLFIETHSDHILNGLRLATREGLNQNEP